MICSRGFQPTVIAFQPTVIEPHKTLSRVATIEPTCMTNIGQRERATQNRIVALLTNQLGYTNLGNREDRPNNSNIEESELRTFLRDTQGYSESLIVRALFELNKFAGDQTKSLYDINKEIYRLLRYGIKIKESVGENKQTVWLVNWNEPQKNNFGVAEEVTN